MTPSRNSPREEADAGDGGEADKSSRSGVVGGETDALICPAVASCAQSAWYERAYPSNERGFGLVAASSANSTSRLPELRRLQRGGCQERRASWSPSYTAPRAPIIELGAPKHTSRALPAKTRSTTASQRWEPSRVRSATHGASAAALSRRIDPMT